MLILDRADDVTDDMLVSVTECVEDYFAEGQINTEDFIDRLCHNYAYAEDWDIEKYDCPAARKIMRHARQVRRGIA